MSSQAPFSQEDHAFMAEAIRLAERGLFSTDPNPRVGCVLAKDGVIVGRGWHRECGGPHAEVFALQDADNAAKGATAYVSLEPCSHQGRTGPCAEALVDAGVARVVSAMEDPNPLVAGRGHRILREAGVQVHSGLLQADAERLNPGFIKRMRESKPYVRVKVAASLDARTAMASGESQWITGPEARADVQCWRARSSAVVTGIETVLQDDPQLTVRPDACSDDRWQRHHSGSQVRQPRRVVLDSALRMPPNAKLLQDPGVLVMTSRQIDESVEARQSAEALQAAGAEVVNVGSDDGRTDLHQVIDELARRDCNEVWVEAGPTLAGAFVQHGLADELIAYQAPCLMGHAARPLLHLPGLDRMSDRLQWHYHDVRQVGSDLRLLLKPN